MSMSAPVHQQYVQESEEVQQVQQHSTAMQQQQHPYYSTMHVAQQQPRQNFVYQQTQQMSQSQQQQQQIPEQFASSHHDYATVPSYAQQQQQYISSPPSSTYMETPIASSSYVSHSQQNYYQQPQQQQIIYQQPLPVAEPRVVSNDNNRYTIVGHTAEGQPIYALQSTSQTEHPKLQQTSQIYRLPSTSGQPRYAYAVQPQVQKRPQQPARQIAQEYYLHNNDVLSEVRATPVMRAPEQTSSSRDQQSVSSACAPVQTNTLQQVQPTSAVRIKRKAVSMDDEQRQSEQINDSAVAAQAGAIQRFSTMAGWKQMGSWLKAAEKNNDWNRLKLLLSQCAQAQLTVELLQSTDTPKFVRKLSKSCVDLDVRKVSGDLVAHWKKLIASPPPPVVDEPKKVGSAKRKSPHPPSSSTVKKTLKKVKEPQTNADNADQEPSTNSSAVAKEDAPRKSSSTTKVTEKAEKPVKEKPVSGTVVSPQPKAPTSNKLTEFNMFEKLSEERKEKKKRPKTAKTYTSKFRSTGLEDEAEEAGPNKVTEANPSAKKKTSIPSKGALDAKKRAATPVPSTSKASSSTAAPPVITSTPPSEKKSAPTPVRKVMTSDSFMAALMDPGNKKPITKPVKKKIPIVAPKPITPTPIMPSVMEGLYSDTSKSLSKDKADETAVSASQSAKIAEAEEPDVTPIGSRKLRFADEFGKELVEIRYFEIEEGERMNVSKLSSEDMKHLEMKRERNFMKQQRSLHFTDFGHDVSRNEGTSHLPWRLIPVTDACFLVERGSKSIAKKIEEERQKNVMRPFYDPSSPPETTDADEEVITTSEAPQMIPLEMIEDDECQVQVIDDGVSPESPPHSDAPKEIPITASYPSSTPSTGAIDVQKLMSQLKEKGIVPTGSGSVSILNKVPAVSTTTATVAIPQIPIVPLTAQSTPAYAAVVTNSTIAQVSAPNAQTTFPPRLPMPPMLPNGQFILPVPQQPPLLNGPVPAGVTPTVGVDPTPQDPSTSDGPYGSYGRNQVRQCTFYQAGKCNFGEKCRFAHGDEPTAGTMAREGYGRYGGRGGFGGERGGYGRGGSLRGRGAHRGGGGYGPDDDYRRARGLMSRRGYYDRERDYDRDYDRDRRGYDRYERRRRRSRSRSRSWSRSRSRSRSPPRRPRSPERRSNRLSPRGREERPERRQQSRDEKEKEQKPAQETKLPAEEEKSANEQQKSPPEDPVPSKVSEVVTDSPASPPAE